MKGVVLVVVLAGCLREPPFAGISDAQSDSTTGDAPPYDANLVFVTSTTSSSDTLNGISGANALCNDLAHAANHPGTFVAWLSQSGTSATARLGTARGWVRSDGTPFADQISDITQGTIFNPIRLDEHGTDLGSVIVMTATAADGSALTNDCGGLTPGSTEKIAGGISDATFVKWTQNQVIYPCDMPLHLYCFQIDKSNPVVPVARSGRRAFVSTPWAPSGGLSGADQHCSDDAASASLAGSFKALLANGIGTAASRFSATGGPWIRVDNIPVASTPQGLFAGMPDAPLNVTASGAYIGNDNVWTGAMTPTASSSDSCADWTSSTTGPSGHFGLANRSNEQWFDFAGLPCSTAGVRLYCLEP